jgi:hypothetical protein
MQVKVTLRSVVFGLVMASLTLAGCGRPEDSDVYDYDTPEQPIKVRIGDQAAADEYKLDIGVPLAVTSVIACPNTLAANCSETSDMAIKADRVQDLEARRIFRLVNSVNLAESSALSIVATDGVTVMKLTVRFKRKDAPTSTGGGLRWKSLLFTGDDSINAFDNARKTLSKIFVEMGVQEENVRHLTRMSSQVSDKVKQVSAANIDQALESLNVGDGDACLIHMTSHGSRQGFFLKGQPTLTAEKFAPIIDKHCGDRPTVMLVSACYSGVYIKGEALKKPNRVILTAARHDLTSFGCSPENEYTYWDNCLIANLKSSSSWQGFQDSVVKCIERKEAGGPRSYPQGFFGERAADVPYLK